MNQSARKSIDTQTPLHLRYCPIDRRAPGALSTDAASIIALLTVIATLCISGLLVWSVLSPPPSVVTSYVYPGVLTVPVFKKEDIDSTMVLFDRDSIPHEAYTYVEFCVSKDVDRGSFSNVLESDGYLVSLDTRDISLRAGCYGASFPINIPEGIPAGKYTIHTTMYGSINALNYYNVPFFSTKLDLK